MLKRCHIQSDKSAGRSPICLRPALSCRFGYGAARPLHAFLAAMIFAVLFLPGYWTSSHSAQHLMVAAFYATGLAGVAAVRSRHRFDYLDEGYSLVEAMCCGLASIWP